MADCSVCISYMTRRVMEGTCRLWDYMQRHMSNATVL